MSVHTLPRASVHVLLRESLLVLPCVCLYAQVLLRASVHVPPRASVIMVDVPGVYLSFYTAHSCDSTVAMALGHIMYKSGILSRIIYIIDRNRRNVAPCSVLVKKSAYISPVGQYFRYKSLFSIQYFIKKYRTRMFFVRFLLESFPLFSMSIALMLSWWKSSFSTAYPCPSMKYLNHSHCGKASSALTMLASFELLPFIFCFYDSSITDPDIMDIITLVLPLQYGCAVKDASTHHLMTFRMSDLSTSGRCRVPLMYMITLTRFPL